MLKYNERNEEVDIIPEALELPPVKDLYINDKIGDKSFFRKACKWIYHMYYRDHVLANLPYQERKTTVINTYFNGHMPTNIDGNRRVLAMSEMYVLLQKGIEERLAETIKEAISAQKEKITEIKTTKKERIKIPYSIEYDFDIYKKDEEGKYIKLPKHQLSGEITQDIIVNDSQILINEADKAIKLSNQYDEAVRRSRVEREENKIKYEGVSILEKYHAMTKESQRSYLK